MDQAAELFLKVPDFTKPIIKNQVRLNRTLLAHPAAVAVIRPAPAIQHPTRNNPFDMAKNGKLLKFWFPVIAYSAIIFCVSSLPNLKTPFEGINFDKVAHLLEYMPFGFLTHRALLHSLDDISRSKLVGLTIGLAFVYALSDEYHQSFVMGRSSSIFDALADTIGAFLGSYVYLSVKNKQPKKTST